MNGGKGDINMSRCKSISDEIEREKERLARIDAERAAVQARLESLRTQLAAEERNPRASSSPPAGGVPRTSEDKIALFRRLFRGREDVFARRWSSARTGRNGYSPACGNEWVDGLCAKPNVRCGECPNRALLPLDDRVARDHLLGRHVIGVYPLLSDETCRFLAVDFDKKSWGQDVAAFTHTCRKAGFDPAVERSRSGNGAHVWFFFSGPVPAASARKLGCYLLTRTMARRHELGMDSYDRLFPNQDTMPQGGFGNLIALPFQDEARREGNTVFLDEGMVPHADQWAYLASLPKIEPASVEEMAAEAARRGQVVGVRMATSLWDEYQDQPWVRPPSGRAKKIRVSGSLPAVVRAVFGQRLFVEKQDLPSVLLDQIVRLAAFQNPEFYKKQNLRLSTALTPRVIACAEELPKHIALPRGLAGNLEELLKEHDIALEIQDERSEGSPLEVAFDGQLTDAQEQAARALLEHDQGVFVAPPGTGKTVVGLYVIARRARNTLILVHRRPLLDQWKARISVFLGIDMKDIGQIGAGKTKPGGRIDVAMIQSLVRKDRVDDRVAGYGHVVVDECHHVSAVSFERVMSEVKARYVTGLTATLQRRDGHHPIVEMQCGPTRFAVDPRSQAAQRPFLQRLIVRETAFRLESLEEKPRITQVYRQMTGDSARNEMILADVLAVLAEGRSPIVLTERRDHLEFLAERLSEAAAHVIVLKGGMTPKRRRETMASLAGVPDDEKRLMLATGRYIGEGFDDARLDTLFLAMPISWKGTLTQYVGRLHRLRTGKSEVRVYDYLDKQVPVLVRMFERRSKAYRALGYERDDASSEQPQLPFLDT
jgi:superfamily II DNA or RNA helicase